MSTVLRRIPATPPHELKIELETLWTDSEEKPTRDKWMQVAAMFDRANQMFTEIYRYLNVTKGVILRVAWQTLVTGPTNLSTRAVADDTVEFTSQDADTEFDWEDGRRLVRFVQAPESGVVNSAILMDHRHNILAFNSAFVGGVWVLDDRTSVYMPVAGEPRKLTCWQFRPDGSHVAVTIPTGRTIEAWQILPIKLEPYT